MSEVAVSQLATFIAEIENCEHADRQHIALLFCGQQETGQIILKC